MMKVKEIVMVGKRKNLTDDVDEIFILDEHDCAQLDGFIAVRHEGSAAYVNKDYILVIVPESMERW